MKLLILMHSFFKFLFKFLKEMLAPNLMRSQISEYIFIYTADGAYLSPLAWLKHAATIDVEMKCIMKK